MHVTMVKKQLASGEPCRKCLQAEELLKNRGLWDRVDEIVWAVEGDPGSAGMKLGERYGVETAPFFIVSDDAGKETVYRSALQFVRDLTNAAHAPTAVSGAVDVDVVAREYSRRHPRDILRYGLEHFGADCAIAFSGAEDVVLVHMATELGIPFSVFTLDTGRLHPETYRFIEKVRTHYGVEIEVVSPDASTLQSFVRKKGLFSFYEDGHRECCGIRKVEPLKRVLGRFRAWVTGQRQDQSPATRADIPVVEMDPAFSGRHGDLVKLNPLARWTSGQTWDFIRDNNVPFNPLHERGYVSIGCEPCTRAILPGEHERAGRWWWEEETKRECGLHIGNLERKSTRPPPR